MADKAEKTEKAAKIIDIKSPDKAAPSASSRPLLVTNRSVITNDPMVNPSAEPGDGKPAEPMARTAKTIKPISTDIAEPEKEEDVSATEVAQPAAESKADTEEVETEAGVPASSDSPVATETPTEPAKPAESTESTEPAETPSPELSKTEEDEAPEPISRDAEAASQADEAKAAAIAEAEAARQEELEQLIESGRFSAPINAAHRKRSRTVAVVLCVIAFVLAVAVFDAALDAGLLQVGGIPHTDLLKDN